MRAPLVSEVPDRLDKGETQQVHGQVDRAATAFTSAGVVPLRPRRQDLEVTVARMDMPATAADVLDRNESRIRLEVNRQPRENHLTGLIAQAH